MKGLVSRALWGSMRGFGFCFPMHSRDGVAGLSSPYIFLFLGRIHCTIILRHWYHWESGLTGYLVVCHELSREARFNDHLWGYVDGGNKNLNKCFSLCVGLKLYCLNGTLLWIFFQAIAIVWTIGIGLTRSCSSLGMTVPLAQNFWPLK